MQSEKVRSQVRPPSRHPPKLSTTNVVTVKGAAAETADATAVGPSQPLSRAVLTPRDLDRLQVVKLSLRDLRRSLRMDPDHFRLMVAIAFHEEAEETG